MLRKLFGSLIVYVSASQVGEAHLGNALTIKSIERDSEFLRTGIVLNNGRERQ